MRLTIRPDDVRTDVRAGVSRAEVEDFLFHEAALLDSWQLREWLTLFEPGATFRVPATDDPDGDPRRGQFLIADDYELLQARVRRLLRPDAHAENPRSRTHRMISNVRLVDAGDGWVDLQASVVVHRIKDENVDPYLGRYRHRLALTDGGMRFRQRVAFVETERLYPGGRLSFIF